MTTETAIWMVDWQSESDLDSIRNSCDVYYTQTGNISVLIFKYVYFLIPCFPELIPTRLVHSQNHWSDPSWWVVKDPAPRRAFITFHSHCSFLVTIWSAVLDLTSQFFPLRIVSGIFWFPLWEMIDRSSAESGGYFWWNTLVIWERGHNQCIDLRSNKIL